jgi:predicted RND superfamily exporter protein
MNSGRVADWLPQGRPARVEYDRFVQQFGTDYYLLVSWPGCTLREPRVEQLAEALRALGDRTGLIEDVVSGPELLRELTSPPLRMSRSEALERLQGAFVGPDRETTCLSIRTTGSDEERRRALGMLCETAQAVCGLTRAELRLAGSTYEAIALDEASSRTVRYYAVPAGLVSLLIAALFLQQWRTIITVFAVSVFCQLMAVGVLDITLGRMNVLLIMMPTLIYVLTMSGAVHLVNYCQDAAQTDGLLRGVPRGMRAGRMPCVLAAVTTAAGLLSLCVSQMRPVREFGLLGAVCLILSLGALFLLLPAILLWNVREPTDEERPHLPKFTQNVQAGLERMGAFVVRHPAAIVALTTGLLVVGACGLFRLRAVVDFDRMFSADSEIVRNFEWLEQNLGPLVPIELLIDIPQEADLTVLERLELVGEVEQAVRELPGVTGTLSGATFLPPEPSEYALADLLQRRLRVERLSERLPTFIDDDLLAIDGDTQRWRVTFRLPARGEWDYLGDARTAAAVGERVIARHTELADERIRVTATGIMPVNAETNDQLFADLASSYVMAFLLICPMMMLMVRSVWCGLLAMVPNVAPTLLVFGVMGWTNMPVEISMVLCASLALGIAVDGTLHFLTWIGRGLSRGQSRDAAVKFAYEHCAVAMVQSTLICGSGMLVFAFSEFTPASRFAAMLSLLLGVALFCDLILFPALVCSPLGRKFEPPDARRSGER